MPMFARYCRLESAIPWLWSHSGGVHSASNCCGTCGFSTKLTIRPAASRQTMPKLVAREDQHLVGILLVDIADVLPHGVGRALVPVGGLVGLLGGEDLDEASTERVELVRVGDVAVQADAEVLREHVDAVDAAVQAV